MLLEATTSDATQVGFSLNSTPGATFVVDFYANSAADPSGYGEGERWLGAHTVTTDATTGLWTGVAFVSAALDGELITATATDALGNTSEFSAAVVNTVDLLGSMGFGDGSTSGTINNLGDQFITVVDALDPDQGVVIAASEFGGAVPATISTDGGAATLSLTPGDEVLVTHGSVIVQVLAGSVELAFLSTDGQVGKTSLAAGDGVTFKPESFAFIAAATNTEDVEVLTNGSVLTVAPGQEVGLVQIDIKPDDPSNTINLASNGVISVVLFSSAGFDASQVDVGSVRFAGAYAAQSALSDVNGDGRLDRVLDFRTQETNLRAVYEQLLADDLNEDGVLDSSGQEIEVSLAGQTLGDAFFQGFDNLDLFLSGRKLRELLADLAAGGRI